MIVIKSGKNFPTVYADKAFDEWGTPTDTDIRIVDDWQEIDIPDHAEKIDSSLPYTVDFTNYFKMIENTLWIFNNERIKIKKDHIYMTGGGIAWMFQDGDVEIYDISKVQINFIKDLIQNWNGENYGDFVYNFILRNKIIHFHVNLNETQEINKALINNKDNFIESINHNFDMLKNKYKKNWVWCPSKKKARTGNILDLVEHKYLGKFLLSNVRDFKYYFAKFYPSNAYDLISPGTKAFVQKCTKQTNSACEKVELNVPVTTIYNEIQNIKKLLNLHRSDSGLGWKAFCIHGQSASRTKEESYYSNFLGYRWTDEAIQHMPKTIQWLKTLGYKKFQRVRVMCLEPKGFINLHKDQNHSGLGAVNVAINNPKECKFYLQNHGILDFSPGTAYSLDLSNFHTVINNSDVPRYHIIIHGEK